MLALPRLRDALADAQVVAVSPFVGGDVVSGPAATLMAATGREPSHRGVAASYDAFLDVLVVDEASDHVADVVDCEVMATETMMDERSDAARLFERVRDAVEA
jgi:LPPG:FO 2-phospho-L-lactate transferase